MSESAQQAEPPVPVSFRLTTYWQRARNQSGMTRLDTRRLSVSETLDRVLDCLDDDAVTITEGAITTITIDWTKVPNEVRNPFAFGVRRR